jgi:hypothetical protein
MADTARRHRGAATRDEIRKELERIWDLVRESQLEKSESAREYIHGAGLAFDPEPCHRWETFEKSDYRALLSDWLAIGADLRCSLERAADELTHGDQAEGEALAKHTARRASEKRRQSARAQ